MAPKKPQKRASVGPSSLGISLDAMFSPASFYDVIHAAVPSSPYEPGKGRRPPIVAFYGLKGGAGRTTTLAHVGALLAERGARVLAVDLDLEAPGLDVVTGIRAARDVSGTAHLLRSALVTPHEGAFDVRSSLIPVPLDTSSGGMWVLPAGHLDDRYLATIEELNLHDWHSIDPPQPLQRLVSAAISSDVNPDIVFLDCRTGFHPLSAIALFHLADTVVVVLPLSPQIWDGLSLLVKGIKRAREIRHGRPDLLVVPTLVPPEPIGQAIHDAFVAELAKRVGSSLTNADDFELLEDPDDELSWLTTGIGYDTSLAGVGRLDSNLRATTWTRFRPLADALSGELGSDPDATTTSPLDVSRVLAEMDIDRRSAFAEETSIDDLVDTFVAPVDLARVLDRSSALVVGAKGAGKTWLFRYLVGKTSKPRPHVPVAMTYVVGYAPGSVTEKGMLHLSKEALKELERSGKMVRGGTHIAFWRLYGSAAICQKLPEIRSYVLRSLGANQGLVKQLLEASEAPLLQRALVSLLNLRDVGTLSSSVLELIDQALSRTNLDLTLAYDGLDTAFDVGSQADERQDRFVKALLQLVLERRDLERVHLKVFLREDLFSRVEMKNKSHLEATKLELRWRPLDLWRMALVRARESKEYRRCIAGLPGGVEEPGSIADDSVLRRLLDPLWGATVQGGRKARTAFYIQKRTSDSAGRLFPRTLMQLLSAAVEQERRSGGGHRDRVLRFPAIRHGVEQASIQRVQDLVSEYAELGPYLGALKGLNPTGTREKLIKDLKERVERGTASRSGGAVAGSLYAGPGGWSKVIDALLDVGVLGEYKRGRGAKLAVALLYRPGLEIRAAG